MRRFPALLDAVAAGELHLTGLLMLGPHLTDENLSSVLARAKHRTKKELARLVRQLDPLPDVPPRLEPLGPAPVRLVPEAPTWSEFVASMNPVRELAPGDRPRDWTNPMDSTTEGANGADACAGTTEHVGAADLTESAPAPARFEPQRYKVQFTASDEYVKLVEEAQALLSPAAPRASLVRRAVFERDAGRCTFADTSGRRCRETHGLELHHLKAFAQGGDHTEENLTLRCRAHNALAAEQDFGRDFIELQRHSDEHESWGRAQDDRARAPAASRERDP